MQKKYCDRCGAEIEKATYSYEVQGIAETNSLGYVQSRYDMCPKCLKEFETFMMCGKKPEDADNDAPKVMTRFDKIKATFSALTAEEFAEDMDFDMEEFIEKNRELWCSDWCDKSNCSYGHGESHKYDECIQCRINWLNQKVCDG